MYLIIDSTDPTNIVVQSFSNEPLAFWTHEQREVDPNYKLVKLGGDGTKFRISNGEVVLQDGLTRIVESSNTPKPSLRDYLLMNGVPESDIDNHSSDLYVIHTPERIKLINDFVDHPQNVTMFRADGDWEGKLAIEIPFAHVEAPVVYKNESSIPMFEAFGGGKGSNRVKADKNYNIQMKRVVGDLTNLLNGKELDEFTSNREGWLADFWPNFSWEPAVSAMQYEELLSNHKELLENVSDATGFDFIEELKTAIGEAEEAAAQ